jgi:hypothetical protein
MAEKVRTINLNLDELVRFEQPFRMQISGASG